jgi:hypothetical protein
MTLAERDDNMQVHEAANQEEARKIWDQPAPVAQGEPPAEQTVEAATTEQAPAAQADATQPGEDAAPSGEQNLLDRIAGLEAMLTQVTTRLRNAEGHIGGLGSQLKQQLQAAQQVSASGGEAPSASEIRNAQQSPEAMARLKADYPEFADAMESALNERLSALEQRIQQPSQPSEAVTTAELSRLRAEMYVEVQHPGWQDRVRTPEFVGWLQRQPREVQMLATSDSPQDAVRLLDLHGDAMKAATNNRTQRLSSAAAIPSGRSGASVRQKSVEDMSPEEYWAYLDQLESQKR